VGACYWPSFARERIAREDELNPRLAVFGTDGREQTEALMRRCVPRHGCPVHVVGFEEAELAKHSANLFNALKISYFNAVDEWARALGGRGQPVADIVAAAAEGSWNPAYGIRVGTPFGGACLPKDLEGLLQELRRRGLPHVALVEAIGDVNAAVGARAAASPGG
jgi:UDPglucose 6-dehydrogenase